MTSTGVFTCMCCGPGFRISGIKDATVFTNHHGQLYETEDRRGNQPSCSRASCCSARPWQRACCILTGSVRILNVQQAFISYMMESCIYIHHVI